MHRVREAVRSLHPGYFALVMATGIVSIGLDDQGLSALSGILLALTAVAYVVLLLLTGWRVLAFPGEFRRDLADPARGFGFFTFVAGTNVLGVRLALAGRTALAAGLLVAGGVAWLVFGYLVPWLAVLGSPERPVVAKANGTWFIWVVASQSVATLAAALEPVTAGWRRELALLALIAWSVGVVLYASVGVMVAARLLLYRIRPADLTPPYWVAMGATAISVLAGARIVSMADAPTVAVTRGLVAGTSVVFWAFGTWLVLPLLAAGWWRHVTHRIPLTYSPTWWAVIFPLGMYGVASGYLGRADRLPFVGSIGAYEVWIALAALAATFVAMLVHLTRTLILPRASRPGGPA